MAWGKNGTPSTLGGTSDTCEITDLSGSKFNQFLWHKVNTTAANTIMRINADSGSLYGNRYSSNGGADGTLVSKTNFELNWINSEEFIMVYGVAISGEEKLFMSWAVHRSTAGAGTAPQRLEMVHKYVPASLTDTINQVNVTNTDTGDYAADSNLSALGSDLTPVAGSSATISDGAIFYETDTNTAAAIPFAENVQVGSRAEITDTRKMYHYTSDNFSYDSKSFSVTSQDTIPQGMFFKPDGTKMYMVGRTNDTVYQYSLSTAWDISTSSYDSVSFSVATQDVNPESISFKSDGTKMYMVGSTSDKVYQYTLSTSWDLSTTSYDSVSFSVSSQELTPQGMFFKSDGTKMYIVGYTNDTVYQYSLSSAWDLSTASYDSVSFSVGSQDTVPSGLSFTSNGTKMYIVGRTNDIIYQYTLSTAWDVSTASYDSISFSVTSQESSPQDMFFKSDDTKIYIVGYTNDTVYQYSLGNAWSEEGT